MIAIHNSKYGFHPRWMEYLKLRKIPFKVVNCHSSSIIEDLSDCNILLWHFFHSSEKDILCAKEILYSIQAQGKLVFPNFDTCWHFDDKIAQKYLLEAIEAPLIKSNVFYSKEEALTWIKSTSFPKVFKLRGGASSSNVRLINNRDEAIKVVKKAFGRGFSQYDSLFYLNERWRRYLKKEVGIKDFFKGIIRLLVKPKYAEIKGREKGYVYFQDFIPNNSSDIRVIVISNKAFAIKRYVREGDFRASGSGVFKYEKKEFDERCIEISFETTKKIGAQCLAFDFVFNKEEPEIVEISYGFSAPAYDDCEGYWDDKLHWHEGKFNPYGWIIESLINQLK